MKNSLSDYTEFQFMKFVETIFEENNADRNDARLNELLLQFEKLTGHSAGMDLIYYPESGEECTPASITETVKNGARKTVFLGSNRPFNSFRRCGWNSRTSFLITPNTSSRK
ncbi:MULTISPECIES: bacteriocin immunity protein [unclassified Pseudomonas]|uniref:bacteriocin immunity protein n=1 Tax=unclassified Pseudomonas TaxID=196821 RepID=UPI002AC97F6B|nr:MULTISPECIES: bacteriocin immunity protein [unclassified Pseudomonas]WPX62019.1 bacteriocin immunity protein [Pseudomonas sp. MH10]